jgi:uncharacterized protein with von Willebrand factor type A (vWA) domain
VAFVQALRQQNIRKPPSVAEIGGLGAHAGAAARRGAGRSLVRDTLNVLLKRDGDLEPCASNCPPWCARPPRPADMDRLLTRYVRALRAAGVEASPAETLDAVRTLGVVGVADRQALKMALGIVLAKSAAEKTRTTRCSSASSRRRMASRRRPRTRPTSEQATSNVGESSAGDARRPGRCTVAAGRPRQRRRAVGRAARAAGEVGADEIRFETQVPYFAHRMLDRLGVARLDERRLQQLEAHTPEAQAEADALGAARRRLYAAAQQWVQQRFELFGRPATEAFMTEVAVERSLGRLGPHDMPRMTAAVTRMARRLAQRHSRRRRVELRQRLDLRRMLRANAGHGGVPFHLHFKHHRKDKPRLVAVCDVSGSVAAYVRFLLLFLYALQGEVTDVRCFAFSSHLVDVGPVLDNLPFDPAMQKIITEVGGGSTDYGQALDDLHQHHWDAIDRRTTVLVLGDGRSNHANPRLDLFAEMAARARAWCGCAPRPAGAGARATA